MLDPLFLTVNQWMTQGIALAAVGCFVWGMISVLFSPCHLASIPLIVGYVGGQEKMIQPRQAGLYSLLFTSGLFLTIAIIGILCAALGRMLGDVGNYWQILVGLILIWVALGILGVEKCSIPGTLLYKLNLKGKAGAFFLGLAYGVLSGSCTFGFIAPILAIITVQEKVVIGILYIIFFACGHCLPIVIAGSSTAAVKKLLENSAWNGAGVWFRKIAGSTIVLLGIYFIVTPFMNGISMAGSLENILIISIDALHPEALTAKTSKNIYRLMEQGAYTLDGQSTSPPLTLLAHGAIFSGLGPEKGGRADNRWHKGEPGIKGETIFNTAKSKGYSTGFFYSKEKLGYLVNQSVDHHQWDPEFSLENASKFFKSSENARFCFLHMSGLDRVGPREGWLSPGYHEELFFIDEAIAPLIQMLESKGNYLIIITSDHAGHGTIHGSDHPEDAKLPLVMVSDIVDLKQYQSIPYHVTEFKFILEKILSP